MALNFSSHCRSAREDSEENPNSAGSSAVVVFLNGTNGRESRRRIETSATFFMRPPEENMETVFCLKRYECKRPKFLYMEKSQDSLLDFLCVVIRISSGMRKRSTGRSFKICDSMISSTSSGRTPP